MSRVFVSHVHEDEGVADALRNLVRAELKLDNDVFMPSDTEQVFVGDRWIEKVTESLAAADVVVLMLSRRSVKRPWVNFEAGGAWLMKKTILPCCYGNQNKDELPHPYAGLQAASLPSDAHYVVRSIHHHLKLKSDPPEDPFLRSILQQTLEGTSRSDALRAIAHPNWMYDMLEDQIKRFADDK